MMLANRLLHLLSVLAGLALLALLSVTVRAQAPSPGSPQVASPLSQRSASDWLIRMHDAPRRNNYMGTLVVSSGGSIARSRVWHVCEGDDIIERVQTLSGLPRITFRHHHRVVTYLPQSQRAFTEVRDSLGLLNSRVNVTDASVDQFYTARYLGLDRMAGLDTDVVLIEPRDKFRFAYRIWTEKKTGLIVKMDTLNEQGYTMEQVGYTDMSLRAPMSLRELSRRMDNTQGYTVQSLNVAKSTPLASGWMVKKDVPGFKTLSIYIRPAEAGLDGDTVQWIFSDGLASVSVFIERFAPQLHKQEGLMITGVTHTWVKRVKASHGDWLLTVVGEVPVATLQALASSLERMKP